MHVLMLPRHVPAAGLQSARHLTQHLTRAVSEIYPKVGIETATRCCPDQKGVWTCPPPPGIAVQAPFALYEPHVWRLTARDHLMQLFRVGRIPGLTVDFQLVFSAAS